MDWSLWGLGKEEWGALHTNIGYLFIAASGIHIVFNWKLILNYLRKKTREALAINSNTVTSVIIVLVFSVFTMAEIPPLSYLQTLGEGIKELSEIKYGSPPYAQQPWRIRNRQANGPDDPATNQRSNRCAAGRIAA